MNCKTMEKIMYAFEYGFMSKALYYTKALDPLKVYKRYNEWT